MLLDQPFSTPLLTSSVSKRYAILLQLITQIQKFFDVMHIYMLMKENLKLELGNAYFLVMVLVSTVIELGVETLKG